MRYLFFLLLLTLAPEAFARNYAVLVTGSDSTDLTQQKTFIELSQDAAALYKTRGFEVISLQKNLRDTISQLKDPQELHLIIHSHGESNPFAFVLDERTGLRIDMADLYKTLSDLKIKNPQIIVSLETMACYGGSLSRELKSIPDLQVFSASPSDKKTTSVYDFGAERALIYNKYFYQNLQKGMSYIEAHLDAKESDLGVKYQASFFPEFQQVKDSFDSTPQSNMEALFIDNCLATSGRRNRSESGESRPAEKLQIASILRTSFELDEILANKLLKNCAGAELFCRGVSNHLKKIEKFKSCIDEIESTTAPEVWEKYLNLFEIGSRKLSAVIPN
jgi:hypothetical protein